MAIPIIMTMTATQIIHRPRDILGYVVRHYTRVPAAASNTAYDISPSLIDAITTFDSDLEGLKTRVIDDLSSVLRRYIADSDRVIVNVSTEQYASGDPRYTLVIQVSFIISGTTYGLDYRTSVENNILVLDSDRTQEF